jgi:hypothetical protein
MEREGREERREERREKRGKEKERKTGKRESERERAELQGKPGSPQSLTYWIGPIRACFSESKWTPDTRAISLLSGSPRGKIILRLY